MPVNPNMVVSRMLAWAGMSIGRTANPDLPSRDGRKRIQLTGYSITRKDATGRLPMLSLTEFMR